MRKILIAAALAGTMPGGAAIAGQAGGGMMRADGNHDGAISRDEYMAGAAERFARMDANGDGRISSDEMQARGDGPRRMRRDIAGRGGSDEAVPPADDGAGPPHRRPIGGMGMGGGRMMERLDADHDGKISRDEMRAMADRQFARLDLNHDGVVDQTEMAAMRAMRGPGDGTPGDAPPPPDDAPGSDPGE